MEEREPRSGEFSRTLGTCKGPRGSFWNENTDGQGRLLYFGSTVLGQWENRGAGASLGF